MIGSIIKIAPCFELFSCKIVFRLKAYILSAQTFKITIDSHI
jgi:hypothetical protein